MAQVIDDTAGRTSRRPPPWRRTCGSATGDKSAKAKQVGALVAERAKAAGVEQVVFDRAGNKYHGRIAALADSAREAGLGF
jgi:large subunit ribosomal protein L18